MASPFSIFRKNQKVMIAVLGVLAMFAFVFIPIIMQLIGERSTTDPVVVKTKKYGDLHASYVQRLEQQHIRLIEVLARLSAEGRAAAAVAAGQISPEDRGNLAARYAAILQQQFEAKLGTASEENVVHLWLLARQAEEQGMTFSDEIIRQNIKNLTQDSLKAEEIKAMLDHFGLTPGAFFAMFRELLLVQQIQASFQVSLEPATPGQRWDYFNRVKRLATIEAIPVPVSRFTKDVSKPSEKELKEFFEKYKEKLPAPASPEPGFKQPHEVAIEYLQARIDDFASPKTISDDEVKKYYEKHKAYYDQLIQAVEGAKRQFGEPGANAAPAKKEQAAPKSEQKANPQPPATKPGAKDGKKTSSVDKPSAVVLASYAADEAAAKSSGVKAAAPAAKPEPAKPAPKTPLPDLTKTGLPDLTKTTLPGLPEKFLPDTIKEQIRREIARDKILKVFEGPREAVDRFGDEWNKYEVEKLKSQGEGVGAVGAPPSPPDFAAIGKKSGLASGRTGLIPQWKCQETEIGASIVGGRSRVWQYAYQALSTFRPATSTDATNVYLFWKTKDEKERVPSFTEKGVAEQVLQTWKMIHARELALKQAKQLVDQAAKAKKPLKRVFGVDSGWRVVLPPRFSWMTLGHVASSLNPQPARLGSVAGVDMAGDEFMRTVFGLQPGQVGVAFNAPKTIAYVIRVEGFSPVYEARLTQFEEENYENYASAGADAFYKTMTAWMDEIKKSAGFEWAPGHPVAERSSRNAPARRPVESEVPLED